VDDREELRSPVEQPLHGIEVELAVLEHRHVRKLGLAVLAEQLPRDDVRVMLHLGEHDEIAALHVLAAPGIRDEVDRRRRVGREDRLLRGGSEPVGDSPSRTLVQVGRLDRQRVDAAMNRRP
jgi:hypothetical protein